MGFFNHEEKRQLQKAAMIPIGLLFLALGASTGEPILWGVGLLALGLGAYAVYERVQAGKRARENEEIRAYELRRARGQV